MKSFLSSELISFLIFALIIPTYLFGNEIYSKSDSVNIADSADADSIPPTKITPIWKAGFIGYLSITFGVGHHENFTKAKPKGLLRAESGSGLAVVDLEAGVHFLKTYLYGFGGVSIGPSGHTDDEGYEHSSSMGYGGVAIKHIMLPRWSKVNFIPKIGYEKWKESAEISYPKGGKPTLLDESHVYEGKFFGLETVLRLGVDTSGSSSIRIEYQYSDFDVTINRFKFVFSYDLFGRRARTDSKNYIFNLMNGSIGIEFRSWADGRKDWFLIFGGKFEGNFPVD